MRSYGNMEREENLQNPVNPHYDDITVGGGANPRC